MKLTISLIALSCYANAATLRGNSQYTEAQLLLQINDLPGLPETFTASPNFKMFSGYIPVNALGEQPRSLFFWFVESQRDPKKDPVVMWTNGGPGCSGLGGFFVESGPFRATSGGRSLVENPYAWNKVASMIYIEQPAGVGFSTIANSTSFQYGDDQAAADNYRFVRGFFERFPQYATRDFYAAGESYAGHYVPMLAEQIMLQGKVPNFKGIMVGNPATYLPYETQGTLETFHGQQLIPDPLYKRYVDNKCEQAFMARRRGTESSAMSQVCNTTVEKIYAPFMGAMNIYGINFPVCTNEMAMQMREKVDHWNRSVGIGASASSDFAIPAASPTGLAYFPQNYQPCSANFSWSTDYLNRHDVQRAIHVKASVSESVNGSEGGGEGGNTIASDYIVWEDCSSTIGRNWNETDKTDRNIVPVYQRLIAQNQYSILVYSGDDDAACPTAGTQKWIWSLGNGVTPVEGEEWEMWKVGGQLAGFNTLFHGKLRFVTVHGAGHMVPTTRPEQALEMITRQLEGSW